MKNKIIYISIVQLSEVYLEVRIAAVWLIFQFLLNAKESHIEFKFLSH